MTAADGFGPFGAEADDPVPVPPGGTAGHAGSVVAASDDAEFPSVDEEDEEFAGDFDLDPDDAELDDDDLDDGTFDDGEIADDDMDEVAKARLNRALAEIDARLGRPPAEQVEAFAALHQQMQATLTTIDAS